jgi:DNA-binding IclR family transcriptional regulator
LRHLSAVRVAEPKIAALANEIKHTVSLTVWGTHGPTVVRLEEPNHPVHIMMRVGSVMGMLETATGRIFAAFLPQEVAMVAPKSGLDHFGVGYNSKRAVTGSSIKTMLADIRARHLARAVGDPFPGINAFAAPVFDHEGAVVLSVTAMGPERSFDAHCDQRDRKGAARLHQRYLEAAGIFGVSQEIAFARRRTPLTSIRSCRVREAPALQWRPAASG